MFIHMLALIKSGAVSAEWVQMVQDTDSWRYMAARHAEAGQ